MPKVKFKGRTTAEIENLDIENGSLIYNIENGKTYLDYDDERIPTGGGAGATVSDTPPENPQENDLWVDTSDDEYLARVDSEISTTSTNAVQNQAITNYVNWKYVGTATGQNYITLPSNWNELLCIVLYNGSTSITGQTHILRQFVESPISAANFGLTSYPTGGSSGNAQSYNGGLLYNASNGIRIEYAPGATNTSILYVYYK